MIEGNVATLVGYGIDVALLVLLFASLVYSIRLSRKLHKMRTGKDGLPQAVAQLESASAKVESQMTEAFREAREVIAALDQRVAEARELDGEIDHGIKDVERAIERAKRAMKQAEDIDRRMSRVVPPAEPKTRQESARELSEGGSVAQERQEQEPEAPVYSGRRSRRLSKLRAAAGNAD